MIRVIELPRVTLAMLLFWCVTAILTSEGGEFPGGAETLHRRARLRIAVIQRQRLRRHHRHRARLAFRRRRRGHRAALKQSLATAPPSLDSHNGLATEGVPSLDK